MKDIARQALYKTVGFRIRGRHLACPALGSNMSSVSRGVNTVVPVPNKQVLVNLLGILILLNCPVSSSGKEEAVGHGNFSESPTNHEEVLVRNQDISPSESDAGDDFWVGSHKLEFKPHPLLMPSTHSPATQIPIPIIELGSPPTTPSPLNDESSFTGDENSEGSTNESNKKKSRDRRKKSRSDQRNTLSHRTLWTSGNSNANGGSRGVVIKSLDQQIQHLQQPVILSGGSGGPTSLVLPSNRNDDSFRGSASTWNINHPNNNLNVFNAAQQQSQDHHQHQNNQQVIQQSPQHQQQYQFVQQPKLQYQVPQQPQIIQQPPSFSMSTGPEYDFSSMMHHAHSHQQPQQQQFIQQAPPSPPQGTGNNGPYLVYVPPGMSQIAQASAAMPVKAMSFNEIPMDYGRGNTHHSSFSGNYGESNSHGYHSHSPNNGPNPHYLRNNILRVFMDKLASVGKSLPIPFVTKFSQPPPVFSGHGSQNQQHHHASHQMNHVVYPPIMQPTTVYNRHYLNLSRRMR